MQASINKKIKITFWALIFFFSNIVVVQLYAQTNLEWNTTVKTPIALLGTYHFDNPNQDQFNVKSDNVFSDKRQKEIELLVKQLAEFRPTHIALEFNVADSASNEKYHQYLKNSYTLDASEREQIGFRLAKMLGHQDIYPVDEPSIRLDFNPGELVAEYGPLLEQLTTIGNGVITEINESLKKHSISKVLANLNSPEYDKLNVGLYYKYILPIGKGDTQPGLHAVVRWYERNLFILKHIQELTASGHGEKRIMVIFGQGHTAMLKQFVQYSDDFELVDIQQFLPKE
jgi:Family of unknown function (DUF5694)